MAYNTYVMFEMTTAHKAHAFMWSHAEDLECLPVSLQVALERAIVSMRLRFRVAFWVMRLLIQSVSPSVMLKFIEKFLIS